MSAPVTPTPRGFRIIADDERLAASRVVKATIFGQSGIGKTSLLSRMGAASLFLALEGDR